jgi:large subunit ribosomal protein LP0
MGGRSDSKAAYFDKLKGLLDEYKTIFIVSVDNVSSQQMHEIRVSLRGQGVVLMGKNTMVWAIPKLEYSSGASLWSTGISGKCG